MTLKDQLRTATLGAPSIIESKQIVWAGQTYELRRPTLRQQREITQAAQTSRKVSVPGAKAKVVTEQDNIKAALLALVNCVYVPGTQERVFDVADLEAMMDRGEGDFVAKFIEEFAAMSNVDVEAIEKN